MAGSEDILITENSPIFRMLLLASLFVEISGQDTICYQEISFHQICPHEESQLSNISLPSSLISIITQFRV